MNMKAKSRHDWIRAGFVLALLVFVYITRSTWVHVLAVFALAGGFSLLALPVCRRMEKLGMDRKKAALAGIAALLLVLGVFLLIFVPYLFTHTMNLIRRLTPTMISGAERIFAWLKYFGIDAAQQIDIPKLLSSSISPLTTGLAKGGAALITAVGHVIFSFLMAYYLLTIRYELGCHLLMLIETSRRSMFLTAVCGCRNAVMSYLSGLIKTCVFVGGATFAGLLLLGIGDALILAFFMGVLEVLPYVGPILGAVPILISALSLGAQKAVMALLLVFVVQQLESGVIGPYFTASSTSIHPLAALAGVFIGGGVFGIAGILLSVPLMIIARSVMWSLRSAANQHVS